MRRRSACDILLHYDMILYNNICIMLSYLSIITHTKYISVTLSLQKGSRSVHFPDVFPEGYFIFKRIRTEWPYPNQYKTLTHC